MNLLKPSPATFTLGIVVMVLQVVTWIALASENDLQVPLNSLRGKTLILQANIELTEYGPSAPKRRTSNERELTFQNGLKIRPHQILNGVPFCTLTSNRGFELESGLGPIEFTPIETGGHFKQRNDKAEGSVELSGDSTQTDLSIHCAIRWDKRAPLIEYRSDALTVQTLSDALGLNPGELRVEDRRTD